MSNLWKGIKEVVRDVFKEDTRSHVYPAHTGHLREIEMANEVRHREIKEQLDRIEAMLQSLHMKLYGKVEP